MSVQTAVQNIAVDLIFGAVISAGTSGDKAKQAARAAELASIVGGLQKIVDGDVPGGLASLQTALVTTALAPAEAMAVQNFVSFAATQASALEAVAGGTLLGQLNTAVADNVAKEILSVCAKYATAA